MAEPVNETIAANALGPTSKPVGFRKIMMADEIPSGEYGYPDYEEDIEILTATDEL